MRFKFEDFVLDLVTFELRRAGEAVQLPRLAFDLIHYLIAHRDRPVTKEELFENVWAGRVVTEASLSQAMTASRRAVGDHPRTQRIIKTVHGRGYWWVSPTTVLGSPRATSGRSEPPLVGRDSELGALTALWERASNRSGGVAVVAGEAGTGKSRLVEAFARAAHALGATVVWSYAQESRPTPPMSMWLQVATGMRRTEVCRTPDIQDLDKLLSRVELGALGEGTLSRLTRANVLASLYAALDRPRTPLLLILEDLHRADPASLQILDAISSRLAGTRTLVVGTSRPPVYAFDEAAKQALEAVMARSHVALLPLQGLTQAQVPQFLEACGNHSANADLLWEKTGGNPFLLSLLIRLDGSESTSWLRTSGDIPTLLARALTARCEELPSDVLHLLQVASVVGHVFDTRVVRSVRGTDASEVGDLLDYAEQAGLVDPICSDTYRFRHAILRDALYERLGGTRRAELHHTIALFLDNAVPPTSLEHLAEVAHHYAEGAAAGGGERAIQLLTECGAAALSRGALDDAASLWSQALQVGRRSRVLSETREGELRLMLGEVLVAAGRRQEGRDVLVQASHRFRLRRDYSSLGRAALALAPGLLSIETGELDGVLVDLLECALAGPDDGSTQRTELLGRLALALYWAGEDDRRGSLITQLATVAERLPQTESIRAQLYWVAASWGPSAHHERRRKLDALSTIRRSRPRPESAVLRVFAVTSCLERGDWSRARKEIGAFEAEVRATKDPLASWYPPMYRAMLALADGKLGAAAALVSSYAPLGLACADRNVDHCVAAQLGEASWLRGEVDVAISGAESLVDRFPGMLEWRCVLAFFLALGGRREAASVRIAEVLQGDGKKLPQNMNAVLAACALSEAVVRARLAREAPLLRRILGQYLDRDAVAGFGVVSWGSVARFVGRLESLLGLWSDAEKNLRAAVERDAASGCEALMVRSELALAEMLAARQTRPDEVESLELVERALLRIQGKGLSQLERDAATVSQVWGQIVVPRDAGRGGD